MDSMSDTETFEDITQEIPVETMIQGIIREAEEGDDNAIRALRSLGYEVVTEFVSA